MKIGNIATYKRLNNTYIFANTKINRAMSMGNIIISIAAIFLSRVSLLGVMAPFGLAWYCANVANDGNGLVFAGALIGTLLMSGGIIKIKYMLALCVYASLRQFVKTTLWDKPIFNFGIATSVMLVVGLCYIGFNTFTYYDVIMTLLEGISLVGGCILFSKSSKVILKGNITIGDEEAISLAILAGCVVAGLQGINIVGIKLANILSIYIILVTAYCGGTGMSGAVGAALGLICGLSQGDAPGIIGVYAFVGLSSGVMRIFGKMGIAIGAAFANAAFAAYYNGSSEILINIIEITISATVFYLTPNYLFEIFGRYMTKQSGMNPSLGYIVRQKNETSKAMADIKDAIVNLAHLSEQNVVPISPNSRISTMCDQIASQVCDNCGMGDFCWNKNFESTNKLFMSVVERVAQGDCYEKLQPSTLTGKCVHSDKLIKTATTVYHNSRADNLCKFKELEYRNHAAKQYKKIAEVIENEKNKLEEAYVLYSDLSDEVSRILYRSGLKANGVCVVKNKCGMYEVSAKISGEINCDIEDIVSSAMEKEMIIISNEKKGNEYLITLCEKDLHDYEIAVVTMDNSGQEITGDCAHHFVSEDGVLYCVLSDGMGSGKKAAKDSGSLVNLFEKLVTAGFGTREALSMINGTLIMGRDDESCTTADVAKINLRSGCMEFVKAGACGSVVKLNNEIMMVRWSSMPLGILDIDEFNTKFMTVVSPTYVVMMTDGVPDNGGDRFCGEEFVAAVVNLCNNDMTPKEMADNIMIAALSKGKPKDDMTVLVAKIYKK